MDTHCQGHNPAPPAKDNHTLIPCRTHCQYRGFAAVAYIFATKIFGSLFDTDFIPVQ